VNKKGTKAGIRKLKQGNEMNTTDLGLQSASKGVQIDAVGDESFAQWTAWRPAL